MVILRLGQGRPGLAFHLEEGGKCHIKSSAAPDRLQSRSEWHISLGGKGEPIYCPCPSNSFLEASLHKNCLRPGAGEFLSSQAVNIVDFGPSQPLLRLLNSRVKAVIGSM